MRKCRNIVGFEQKEKTNRKVGRVFILDEKNGRDLILRGQNWKLIPKSKVLSYTEFFESLSPLEDSKVRINRST